MEDLIFVAFVGVFAVLLVLDRVLPGINQPRVRWWRLKGLAFTAIAFGVGIVVPLAFDEWFAAHRLIDASGLGVLWGAVVGLLVLELAQYWWHRALHRVPALWRMHQLHHSAERLDVYGANLFHPLDIAGFNLVGSVALVWIVGVQAEAAVIAVGVASMLALFQHANLKTPRWLGYLVHRPENHGVHHQRGVHAHNYGSLTLFDLAFGTFHNPTEFPREFGFYEGASARMPEMLAGLDVSEPEPTASSEIPAFN